MVPQQFAIITHMANANSKQTPDKVVEQNPSTDNGTPGAADAYFNPPRRPASERHGHDDVVLNWEASEYMLHDKSFLWYVVLVIGAAALGAVFYFVLKDISSLIVVVLLLIAVFVYSKRQPHTLAYSITESSLIIGHKEHHFEEFKSFSVISEDGIENITLIPVKRFAPPLSIYFDPNDRTTIVEALSAHLPQVERSQDVIDQLSRKLKF